MSDLTQTDAALDDDLEQTDAVEEGAASVDARATDETTDTDESETESGEDSDLDEDEETTDKDEDDSGQDDYLKALEEREFSRKDGKRMEKWNDAIVDGSIDPEKVIAFSKDPFLAKTIEAFAEINNYESVDELLAESEKAIRSAERTSFLDTEKKDYATWESDTIKRDADWKANWEPKYRDMRNDMVSKGYSLQEAGELAYKSISFDRGQKPEEKKVPKGMNKAPRSESSNAKKTSSKIDSNDYFNLPEDKRLAYAKAHKTATGAVDFL